MKINMYCFWGILEYFSMNLKCKKTVITKIMAYLVVEFSVDTLHRVGAAPNHIPDVPHNVQLSTTHL
jgi:hypothetical protein